MCPDRLYRCYLQSDACRHSWCGKCDNTPVHHKVNVSNARFWGGFSTGGNVIICDKCYSKDVEMKLLELYCEMHLQTWKANCSEHVINRMRAKKLRQIRADVYGEEKTPRASNKPTRKRKRHR